MAAHVQRIRGFQHTPGFEYELKVLDETIPNPPADGSSRRRTLLEIVSESNLAFRMRMATAPLMPMKLPAPTAATPMQMGHRTMNSPMLVRLWRPKPGPHCHCRHRRLCKCERADGHQ
ncbi:MAG: DUF4377 domain-containing protein [Caldilineaceae bacterium]|nr:DUF4377 domain-containing protein [Caldilineaceae bacterium]